MVSVPFSTTELLVSICNIGISAPVVGTTSLENLKDLIGEMPAYRLGVLNPDSSMQLPFISS